MDDPYWGHILNIGFGGKASPLDSIVELAKNIDRAYRGKKINGFDLDILLKEHYTEEYNLQNLNDPHKNMALIAMSPVEEYGEDNYIYHRINEFKIYEIQKHWNLSLEGFLNLPRDWVEFMIKTVQEENKKIQQAKAAAEADAKKLAGNPQAAVSNALNLHGMNPGM